MHRAKLYAALLFVGLVALSPLRTLSTSTLLNLAGIFLPSSQPIVININFNSPLPQPSAFKVTIEPADGEGTTITTETLLTTDEDVESSPESVASKPQEQMPTIQTPTSSESPTNSAGFMPEEWKLMKTNVQTAAAPKPQLEAKPVNVTRPASHPFTDTVSEVYETYFAETFERLQVRLRTHWIELRAYHHAAVLAQEKRKAIIRAAPAKLPPTSAIEPADLSFIKIKAQLRAHWIELRAYHHAAVLAQEKRKAIIRAASTDPPTQLAAAPLHEECKADVQPLAFTEIVCSTRFCAEAPVALLQEQLKAYVQHVASKQSSKAASLNQIQPNASVHAAVSTPPVQVAVSAPAEQAAVSQAANTSDTPLRPSAQTQSSVYEMKFTIFLALVFCYVMMVQYNKNQDLRHKRVGLEVALYAQFIRESDPYASEDEIVETAAAFHVHWQQSLRKKGRFINERSIMNVYLEFIVEQCSEWQLTHPQIGHLAMTFFEHMKPHREKYDSLVFAPFRWCACPFIKPVNWVVASLCWCFRYIISSFSTKKRLTQVRWNCPVCNDILEERWLCGSNVNMEDQRREDGSNKIRSS
jgi:hypothetical protein